MWIWHIHRPATSTKAVTLDRVVSEQTEGCDVRTALDPQVSACEAWAYRDVRDLWISLDQRRGTG